MKSPPDLSDPLTGIIAATFTPFDRRGEVNLELIPKLTEHLIENGVSGIYICGSTGEGPSLTIAERKAVTEAYLKAANAKIRTVVHVGHTCLSDAQDLGRHAVAFGATAISAIAPYYYKPEDTKTLVAFLKEVAKSASSLPFYYYHMPGLTGLAVDPIEFLIQGKQSIANLRGMKFTDADLSKFSACQSLDDGRFDLVFGRDEMLLPGLAVGAQGAVGSTYNLAPALYQRIVGEFEKGNLEEARRLQETSVAMIHRILGIGGEAALKYPMKRLGLDCGPRRLPMNQLSSDQERKIDLALDELGFDNWAVKGAEKKAA
ncbi:MAG: dihydrodipicolinate synthase family protein [Verrucomicrobiota bacterium]